MINPIEMMVQNMIKQSGGNLQMMAENILKNNPKFANAIRGQNLQNLTIQQMQNRGIDPHTFMNGGMNKR